MNLSHEAGTKGKDLRKKGAKKVEIRGKEGIFERRKCTHQPGTGQRKREQGEG